MTNWKIFRPQPADIPRLQQIEIHAGQLFRDIGMAAIADDPPPSAEILSGYLRREDAWAILLEPPHIAGYLLGDVVDGCLHIEQVSVDPAFARRGAGGRLIRNAAGWALDRRLNRVVGDAPGIVTLTTFRDVPWNAPYYRRLGFEVVDELAWGDEMRTLRAGERDRGLDTWPRVVMAADILDLT